MHRAIKGDLAGSHSRHNQKLAERQFTSIGTIVADPVFLDQANTKVCSHSLVQRMSPGVWPDSVDFEPTRLTRTGSDAALRMRAPQRSSAGWVSQVKIVVDPLKRCPTGLRSRNEIGGAAIVIEDFGLAQVATGH